MLLGGYSRFGRASAFRLPSCFAAGEENDMSYNGRFDNTKICFIDSDTCPEVQEEEEEEEEVIFP